MGLVSLFLILVIFLCDSFSSIILRKIYMQRGCSIFRQVLHKVKASLSCWESRDIFGSQGILTRVWEFGAFRTCDAGALEVACVYLHSGLVSEHLEHDAGLW